MNKNSKAFIVYITFFNSEITIYLARKAQIALPLAKKVIVLAEYSDFANLFSKKSADIFLERNKVNEQAIKLDKDKQLLYRLMYSLGLVELKTLKTYIKTNLANGFIRVLKLLAGV